MKLKIGSIRQVKLAMSSLRKYSFLVASHLDASELIILLSSYRSMMRSNLVLI